MKLEITDALLEEIRGHGQRAYPHECCGALLGLGRKGGMKRPLPSAAKAGEKIRAVMSGLKP